MSGDELDLGDFLNLSAHDGEVLMTYRIGHPSCVLGIIIVDLSLFLGAP